MELLRGVVLFIFLKDINSTRYYISEETTDWTTASRNCELAAPDLLSLPSQITLLQDADIDEVWVGYYQARTALEYYGCTEKDSNIQMIKTKADPGECLSVCGTKNIFGIFGNECFCLDIHTINVTYQNTTASFCNKICDKLKGTVCGGLAESTDDENTKSYMSLYRSIGTDNTTGAGSSDSICKYYDHEGFHWDSCDKPFQFICEKGSSVWIQNNNEEKIYKSWNEATQLCFANDTRPSTYNNTKNLHKPFGTAQLWTGIVRSDVTYTYSTDSSQIQHAKTFGILKRKNNGNKYTLKFRSKNDERRGLCVNETSMDGISSSSTATSSSERTIVTSSTTDNTDTAVPDINTSVYSSSTIRSSSETDSTNQLQNTSDSSSAGAIVGATITVVVVLAVVILVVFFRKRGVQLPCLREEKPTHSPSISRNNAGYAISEPTEVQKNAYNTSQNEYTEIELKTATDNGRENSMVNCATETSEYEHDYFVLEKQKEEQYDSTKPEFQKFDENTFNPYNKLSLDGDLDYDHVGDDNIHGGISGRNASVSDGTYNTSLGYSNLKTSKNAPNNEYNMADDAEDTYNHTNELTWKNGLRVSENDYDAI